MLVALAANDLFIDTSVLDLMKKEYDDAETVLIENCSHFIQQEEPEKANKAIREFLAKHNIWNLKYFFVGSKLNCLHD